MADIKIYGKLKNDTPEGILAGADQIKDDTLGKKQSDINSDLTGRVEELEKNSGGVSSYEDLTEKPSIGGIELVGNKSASDLGLQSAGDYAIKSDLNSKLDTSIYNQDKLNFATKEELEGKVDDSEISDMLTKTEASTTYSTKEDINGVVKLASLDSTIPTNLMSSRESSILYGDVTIIGEDGVHRKLVFNSDGTVTWKMVL